jgi:hypothetical protein
MTGLKQKTAETKRQLASEAFKKRILHCRQARKRVLTHLKGGELLVNRNDHANTAPFLSNWSSTKHRGVSVIALQRNSGWGFSLTPETMVYMGACECDSCVYTHKFDTYHLLLWSRGEQHETHYVSSDELIDKLALR